MSYQLSAVVSGFTPLVAMALYGRTGWIGPALLFSFYGLLGLVATLVTKFLGASRARARGTPGTRDHARAADGSERRSGRCVGAHRMEAETPK